MNEIELRATKKLAKLYEEMLTHLQEENRKMRRAYGEMVNAMGGAEGSGPDDDDMMKDLIQKMMLLKEIIGI
ncbi:MAG: hypothetical protein SCAL_001133 [Candidatus Syntrophoarchaeum caldarius]|uniref:Uncharacterized protein n=1 Tax=Candidatus Syntropharchaeum caldarium TaxID=1838285 RepID=A0A1F2P917_9EURY|nr:MAG: hypothetical protein SCAL_001133 [Candidatus Syntrophoarchaeum caldarius]